MRQKQRQKLLKQNRNSGAEEYNKCNEKKMQQKPSMAGTIRQKKAL